MSVWNIKTIYYIDSENVGDSWIELLNTLDPTTCRVLVFYTKHSPRMAYAQAIQLMNAAGYDAATLGNHEFDYGMDQLLDTIVPKAATAWTFSWSPIWATSFTLTAPRKWSLSQRIPVSTLSFTFGRSAG